MPDSPATREESYVVRYADGSVSQMAWIHPDDRAAIAEIRQFAKDRQCVLCRERIADGGNDWIPIDPASIIADYRPGAPRVLVGLIEAYDAAKESYRCHSENDYAESHHRYLKAEFALMTAMDRLQVGPQGLNHRGKNYRAMNGQGINVWPVARDAIDIDAEAKP
jgi:hypothetical protein